MYLQYTVLLGAAASTLLSSIASDFQLDQRKDQEYLDYQTCFDLLVALRTEDRVVLTDYEEGQLLTITDKTSTHAAGMAAGLLHLYGDMTYIEPLVDPELRPKSNRAWRTGMLEIDKPSLLKVFPNPADDHLMVELTEPLAVLRLEIVGAKGGLLFSLDQTNGCYLHDIPVGSLSQGIYSLRLIGLDGTLLEERIFEIIR